MPKIVYIFETQNCIIICQMDIVQYFDYKL